MRRKNAWHLDAISFFDRNAKGCLYPSVPGGPITLYGSCYANMARYYLNHQHTNLNDLNSFAKSFLCNDTGLYNGPELKNIKDDGLRKHSRRHLLEHLTCSAVLPALQEFNFDPGSLRFAIEWCSIPKLKQVLDSVDWREAWLEGNNILFIGQSLLYLRDYAERADARDALDFWFDWLDQEADIASSIWGTNGFCSPMEAVYGG